MSECPGSEKNSVHANYTVTPTSRNKFELNGPIYFGERLAGQLDVRMHLIKYCRLFIERFRFTFSYKSSHKGVISI